MYSAGIQIHFFATMLLLMMIFINIFRIERARDIHRYAKKSQLINPLASLFLATVIFTGMVMMAAKHLDFNFANIVMIIFGIVFILLEAKRMKQLRYLDIKQENPLENYRKKARKLLLIELVGTVLISVWMLV